MRRGSNQRMKSISACLINFCVTLYNLAKYIYLLFTPTRGCAHKVLPQVVVQGMKKGCLKEKFKVLNRALSHTTSHLAYQYITSFRELFFFFIARCVWLIRNKCNLFPLDPQIYLLGNFTIISAHLRNFHKRFLEIALCIARKCTAASWKFDSHLPIARQLLEMNSCIPLEFVSEWAREGFWSNVLVSVCVSSVCLVKQEIWKETNVVWSMLRL